MHRTRIRNLHGLTRTFVTSRSSMMFDRLTVFVVCVCCSADTLDTVTSSVEGSGSVSWVCYLEPRRAVSMRFNNVVQEQRQTAKLVQLDDRDLVRDSDYRNGFRMTVVFNDGVTKIHVASLSSRSATSTPE